MSEWSVPVSGVKQKHRQPPFLERMKMFSILTVDKSCIPNKESIVFVA